jgi:serine/threonine protein kinase
MPQDAKTLLRELLYQHDPGRLHGMLDAVAAETATGFDVYSATQSARPAPAPQHWPRHPAEPTWSEERYTVQEMLGKGGMGTVHRVYDQVLNRTVALKRIRLEAQHPDTTARFLREAHITARLRHPGVVAVHELGHMPDGTPYFTMNEIRGRTLGEILRLPPDQRWELRRLVNVFLHACQTMGYAHEQGVVHRDLKPNNIMLGPHGEVLVVDWGLAKRLGSDDTPHEAVLSPAPDAFATLMGSLSGTPAYMSPEQARGQTDQIGPHTDVYSLGATLWQILAGRPPHTGPVKKVLMEVASGHVAPLPKSVDKILAQICTRAMAPNPSGRYPNGYALATAVQAWLDGKLQRERGLAQVGSASERLRVADKAAGWALQDEAVTLPRHPKAVGIKKTWHTLGVAHFHLYYFLHLFRKSVFAR